MLRRSPAAAPRAACRSHLACFCRWAVHRDLLAADPVQKADPARTARLIPKPVQIEAITRAFATGGRDVQPMESAPAG